MMLELTDKEQAKIILNVFFKTQASIEKYCGKDKLPEWTDYAAKQFADNIREQTSTQEEAEKRVITELAEVLTVYGSDYDIYEEDGNYILDAKFCGIFKYRKKSEGEGTELTLTLPCEFCTDFRTKIAKLLDAKNISYELKDCGCVWTRHKD